MTPYKLAIVGKELSCRQHYGWVILLHMSAWDIWWGISWTEGEWNSSPYLTADFILI